MFWFSTEFILALVWGCYITNIACGPQVVWLSGYSDMLWNRVTWTGLPSLKWSWILRSLGGCFFFFFMNNHISLWTMQKCSNITERWMEGLRILTCVKLSTWSVNRVRGEVQHLLRNTQKISKLCLQMVIIFSNPPSVYFIKAHHKCSSGFDGCSLNLATIFVTYTLKFWKVQNCTETFSSPLWFLSIHGLFPYSF